MRAPLPVRGHSDNCCPIILTNRKFKLKDVAFDRKDTNMHFSAATSLFTLSAVALMVTRSIAAPVASFTGETKVLKSAITAELLTIVENGTDKILQGDCPGVAIGGTGPGCTTATMYVAPAGATIFNFQEVDMSNPPDIYVRPPIWAAAATSTLSVS